MDEINVRSDDYFAGFLAGIDACIIACEMLAPVSQFAPSKRDVADGLAAGLREARKGAVAEREKLAAEGRPQ